MTGAASFVELLLQELAAAEDAASTHLRENRPGLADWWRWRAHDLRLYLESTREEIAAGEVTGSGGGVGGELRGEPADELGA